MPSQMVWPPPPNKKNDLSTSQALMRQGVNWTEPPSADTAAMCFLSQLNFHKLVIYLEKYVADKQKKRHLETFLPNGNFLEDSSFRSNFWKISWLIQIREQT